MATATHRPCTPGMIGLVGAAGAMLLGAAIAGTIPTGMLDRTADDWRARLPQTSSSPRYVAVGSAPESVEFGRRPLDPALFSGEDMILTDHHGRALLYPAADFVPDSAPTGFAPVPDQAPASATAVTVHRGTASSKAIDEPMIAEPQSAEPANSAASVEAGPVEVAAVTFSAD
jgi:hypothetical protein